MDDAFIAALEHLDRAGDLPGPVDAPSTLALRARAVREHAVAWDPERSRYVLTGTGRQKIASRRARESGHAREARTAEIHQFRRRGDAPR